MTKNSFKPLFVTLCLFLLSTTGYALQRNADEAEKATRDFLEHLATDNAKHLDELSHEDVKVFADKQFPRATIVACSDSRVQTTSFHRDPVNDLFTIRNIGNQIATSEGSVEYGIYHLHTPVLLVLGHSHCGAIAAALGDYSKELAPIRKELDSLHLPKSSDVNAGVVENVHHQVQHAMEKYKDKIDAKELFVIGAVYDFRDDYKKGHGRLFLINVNGEKDPAKIRNQPVAKDLKGVTIGL